MRAYLITVEGERQEAVPLPRGEDLKPNTFSEDELQNFVGGYYEVINLTDDVCMVINEEGQEQDLIFNLEATKLLKKALPKAEREIVGNALVCRVDMIE